MLGAFGLSGFRSSRFGTGAFFGFWGLGVLGLGLGSSEFFQATQCLRSGVHGLRLF